MPHPISWFEINTLRYDSIRQWYADAFGWDVRPVEGVDGMEYAVVDTGGALGGGIAGAGDAPDVLVYIDVPDLDAALGRITELGGTVVTPVTVIPDMVTFALFADPAGNVLGLTLAQGDDAHAAPASPAETWVLLYESADDVVETAPLHYAAHSARVDEFQRRGQLLQVGTLGAEVPVGSMATFISREAAEAFVAEDPFVVNGVVRSHRIERWNVL
jgi:predicted enzyme related to lactoylglutathione lyase/uncharacterized protein YciI